MTLEELFYKEVCPEGKNNYVLSGQAKVLLVLCKAVDELKAAEQSVQLTGLMCPACGGNFVKVNSCPQCGLTEAPSN